MSASDQFENPKELLLATWRTWIDLARDTDDGLLWRDHENETCSTLASECMLCFLMPALRLNQFSLNPNVRTRTSFQDDVIQALGDLDEHEYRTMPDIPWSVISRIEAVIEEYFDKTEHDGMPDFRAGSYLAPIDNTEVEIDIVDAYSSAMTVSLCVMRLVAMWRREYSDHSQYEKHGEQWDSLMERSHRWLRASMQGMFDSYTVLVLDRSTWELRTNNRYRWADESAGHTATKLEDLRRRLRSLGLTTGRGDESFECGWSWGPVAPARRPHADTRVAELPDGTHYATSQPYIYFTWMALTGLEDLWHTDVQSSGVLDTDELAMSARLRELWQITVEYWMTIASQQQSVGVLSRAEDLPWTASDGDEDLYFSIYVLGLLMMGETAGVLPADTLIGIIEEITQRVRITRRLSPPDEDPGLQYHSPGKIFTLLAGTDDDVDAGEIGYWKVYDVAPLILKVSATLLPTVASHGLRNRLRQIIASLVDHLVSRRGGRTATLKGLPMASWDEPCGAFPTSRLEPREFSGVFSWYMTERTVEALLALSEAQGAQLETPNISTLLLELLDQLDSLALVSESQSEFQHRTIEQIRATAASEPGLALAEAINALSSIGADRNR